MNISFSLKVCLHANCHLIKNEDEVYVVKNCMHMHFHEEVLHLFLSAPLLCFCSSLHLSSSTVCLVLGWHLSGLNAMPVGVFSLRCLSMGGSEVTRTLGGCVFLSLFHVCVGLCYGQEGGHH